LQLANRLCSGLDRYACAQASEQVSPLFIAGLPRSGTTLAYELIVQAFEVSYFPPVFNYTYDLPNITTRLTSRFTKKPSPKYTSRYGRIPGFFSPAENYNFWKSWFPEHPVLGHHVPGQSLDKQAIDQANRIVKSITHISGHPYVFKNVYFSLSLPALLKAFPMARILVVQRDMDAVAASLYRKRYQLQHKREWWSIKPPFYSRMIDRDLLEQVAFQCVRSNQLMQQAVTEIGSKNCLVASYPEICNSPQLFISKVDNWLGPAFRQRPTCGLPDAFDIHPSIGFPAGSGGRFLKYVENMQADRADYLRKVGKQAETDPRGEA
jgi:hypothetical protein